MNNNNNSIKKTLILPRTDFSLKVNKGTAERMLFFWGNENIYQKSLELNKNKNGLFIIHDGPPYSNGSIHFGHFLNKILKDITLRFYSSLGFSTPFVLGWDTHGLPIEFKVLNGKKRIERTEIRNECRKYALEQVKIQREQLKKLGLWTDYKQFYTTQDKEYEAHQIRILSELVRKGVVYRGLRPIYWSWSHKTALAENEVEYFNKEDNSIFFKISLKSNLYEVENIKILVWTTQPWTIPANQLIAIKRKTNYLLIRISNEFLIVSESFLEKNEIWNKSDVSIKKKLKGEELIGLSYDHPYLKSSWNFHIIDGGDIVSESEGTGVLHVAPSCGLEDFFLAKKENILAVSVINEKGRFSKEIKVPELIGMFYQDANDWIVKDLSSKNLIEKSKRIIHSYPHDWRDKSPLIYRLTEQWFMSLISFKNDVLENIERVDWIPSHSKEKMISFIRNRDDWCISRQRKWGVPIPAISINGNSVIIPEIADYVADYVEKNGSDFWFTKEAKKILRKKFPTILSGEFEVEDDTLDVWFDSGVSSLCVLEGRKEWPANLYLEGKDQFRGWFNSSLIISTIIKKTPPYKKVVSHGFIVDQNGKKMSKSLGNTIDPNQAIEKFGIDSLRLWVSSVDFTKEIRISNEILQGINDSYQKIRNSLRFIIGNLSNIDEVIKSEKDLSEKLTDVDYYILSNLWQLVLDSKDDYLNYKFNNIYNSLNNFCVNKLSSFYFEIIKDSLYCDDIKSLRRKQIVITIYFILSYLLKIISPIIPFLAEELYEKIKPSFPSFFNKKSVHLVYYPDNPSFILDVSVKKVENLFENNLIKIRKEVFRLLEKSRQEKVIETNSQARVTISLSNDQQFDYLKTLSNLEELFLVSEIILQKRTVFSVDIEKTRKERCQRCWKFETLKDSKCQRCFNIIAKYGS